MTYCLGWKSNDAIFMIGDSAVTLFATNVDRVPETGELTSFKEKQGLIDNSDSTYFIEEKALKVHDLYNSAVCFAGSVYLGQTIIDNLRSYLSFGSDPRKAFYSTIQNLSPFSSFGDDDVTLLFGFYENTKPVLLQVDIKNNEPIQEVGWLAQIGSISEYHQQLSERFINHFDKILSAVGNRTSRHIESVLVQLLGLIQSFGIYRYLPDEYVGGAFCGLTVTFSGIQWQPHILYVLHLPEPTTDALVITAVSVTNRTLTIVNNTTGHTKIITNPEPDEDIAAAERRADDAAKIMIANFDQGKFEYICFLNTSQHIVTVVEMCNQISHKLLFIDVETTVEGRIGIVWSPDLLNMVSHIPQQKMDPQHDLCIKWQPYREMSVDDLAYVRNNIFSMRET